MAGAFFATALAAVFWAGVFARLGVLAVVFFAAVFRAPGVAVVAFCAGVFVRPAALAVVVLAAGFRAPGVACAGVFVRPAALAVVVLAAGFRAPGVAIVAFCVSMSTSAGPARFIALLPIPGRDKKGYTTNLTSAGADFVIDAYHQLWRIEKSFRMSKHDLQARPVYHHKRDSIEAHLTIVFAALAVSHYIETQTGWSIKKFVRTARRYRTVQIKAGRQILTAADPLPDDLRDAFAAISPDHAH